jgi:hypothetical protein
MDARARVYLNSVIILGAAILVAALGHWQSTNLSQFGTYMVLALIASTRKVKLPGITGTYSLSFFFILLGISELSLAETITIGSVSAVVQSVWSAKIRPTILQVLFNTSSMVISIASAYSAAYMFKQLAVSGNFPLTPLGASIFFAVNTFLVSGAISMVDHQPFRNVWAQWMLWSVPFYIVGTLVAITMSAANKHLNWKVSLLCLPLVYLASVCYTLCVDRLTPSECRQSR